MNSDRDTISNEQIYEQSCETAGVIPGVDDSGYDLQSGINQCTVNKSGSVRCCHSPFIICSIGVTALCSDIDL